MGSLRPLPVVVGTAGHIDHGKSALIEALTGQHPDRWREEKERGITLDLGYAQLAWPDGLEIGFVDVPGHERLVRKMVAGATGMGAALLVVACDDGVMPQTREHFEVLRLLGVDHGVIVLSKADLADAEVRELVRAEVEALVQGTPWEEAPVVAVSSHTGEGLEELRKALRRTALAAGGPEDPLHAFRLPVQRAFALHGAGTVVTGVVASGEIREGEEVEVLPAGRRSRVRRVQVHGRESPVGRAGLRTALNLPGIEPAEAPRGSVVAAPGTLACGRRVRLLVESLPGAPALEHDSRVQLLAGTVALPGRLFLPRRAEPGEGVVAEMELDAPAALVPGERVLLRRPSPGANLAAGRFLEFYERRLRKRDAARREGLLRFAAAFEDPPALAARWLELQGGERSSRDLARALGWRPEAAQGALEEAGLRGEVRATGPERWLGMGRAGDLEREVLAVIAAWRRRHPWRGRIPLLELRRGLGPERARILEGLDEASLAALGLRRRKGPEWELTESAVPEALEALAEGVLGILREAGLRPPEPGEIAAALGEDPEAVGRALELLCDRGRAVRPGGEGRAFALEAVEALRAEVVEQLRNGRLDIPSLRDRFATTRKYLMPLLEYLDERGVTTRSGPNRILRDAGAALV